MNGAAQIICNEALEKVNSADVGAPAQRESRSKVPASDVFGGNDRNCERLLSLAGGGVLDSPQSSAYTMEFLDGPGEQQDRGGTYKWTRNGSSTTKRS